MSVSIPECIAVSAKRSYALFHESRASEGQGVQSKSIADIYSSATELSGAPATQLRVGMHRVMMHAGSNGETPLLAAWNSAKSQCKSKMKRLDHAIKNLEM